MRLEPVDASDARAVLRGLRGAVLGAGPAIPTPEMVDPALGDAANGMELFRTNCAQCHNAVGAGGAQLRIDAVTGLLLGVLVFGHARTGGSVITTS